jgi:hypothetical protein
VIVVGEDPAAAAHQPVECFRNPHSQALHPAAKRLAIVCFDNQMDVVPEYGEFNETQPEPTQ